jgi:integrase
LRGIHATALLDAGIDVTLVARWIGDDPAVLLRNYIKRQRSKDAKERFATALTALAAGFSNHKGRCPQVVLKFSLRSNGT